MWRGKHTDNFNPRAPCGARPSDMLDGISGVNFNPRAPCGARQVVNTSTTAVDGISIHAPRVGRDWGKELKMSEDIKFQSTRPVWGATGINGTKVLPQFISIHAPRVGRDVDVGCAAGMFLLFQSTRPVWGATANLTILPRQICTKGTKEFLLGRKTHGKKEK